MRKFVKFICMLLIGAIMLPSSAPAMADREIKVLIDGEPIVFEAEPRIVQERTMVPVRAIFEALGAEVEWNNTLQTVTARKGKTKVELRVGYDYMSCKQKKIDLDVRVSVFDGSVFIPLRAVSEAFGTKVVWDGTSGTVYIFTEVTMYKPDGSTTEISAEDIALYLKEGWYEAPVVNVYSPEGEVWVVYASELETYKAQGWYEIPVDTIYALDGRSAVVKATEVAAYLAQGWYSEPVTTIYAPDGRSAIVPVSQVNTYLSVGWYDTHDATTTLMVAPDGRQITVYNAQVSDYVSVGWRAIPKNKVTAEKVNKIPENAFWYTNASYHKKWATVASVHQFAYMDKGLAYAYIYNNALEVVTPDKTVYIEKKYPYLGDIISDDMGNFYAVWGRMNETDDESVETVFISKYSPEGYHIATTGFVGKSVLNEGGNTKVPFEAGTCKSAIANGVMMVNYARLMYNGHQSNNVVGVHIADMSPVDYKQTRDVYCSHSFDQDVIWSNLANDFVYASHGDGYPRGFQLATAKREWVTFKFYLQPNIKYNMNILNETKAEFGTLVETSKGIVLVASSVKSIDKNYFNEPYNVFVQVIDPTQSKVSPEMFTGGVERTGYTTYDIYDYENKPQTPVTDYGVIWITDYKEKHETVYGVHAVVADDRVFIFWATSKGNYYTVLSADGKTLVAPTLLGSDVKFNNAEEPVYHNGKIYWIGTSSLYGTLTVYSMEV